MRSSSKPLRNPFSELEQLVMQSVWRRGAATAEQVREDLGSERELKESTVRTVLKRLEEKGHLKHTVDGRTYVYSSAEAPRNLAIRAVKQIIDRFCAGSVEELLVGMVDNRVIDSVELKRLADKVEKAKKRR